MRRVLRSAAAGLALLLVACTSITAPAANPSAATSAPKPTNAQPTATTSAQPTAAATTSAQPPVATTAAPAAKPAPATDAPTSGGDPNGPSMKIAYASPALASLPYYAALTQGFFALQHVFVQMVRLAPNAAVPALLQGEVDGHNSPDTTLIAATRGVPVKVVLSLWKQAPWVVMGKADINALQNLKGRTVGTNQVGSAPYVYLKAAMERAGMSLNDLNIVPSPGTQDTFALMTNGQLDAAVLSPPFDAQAQLLGYHQVAFIGDALETPYVGLGTTEAFIRDHRPTLVGVIRALMDANAWLKANPAGAADLGVRYVAVDPAASQLAAEKATPNLSDTGEATLNGIQQSIDQQADVANAQRIEAESIVDFGPLHEALAAR